MPTPDAWVEHAREAAGRGKTFKVDSPFRLEQRDRPLLLDLMDDEAGGVVVARKTARIVGLRMTRDFVVVTDRGPMAGVAGDWLVTNHPEDDAGSDLWSVSDERFRSTYEVIE